MTLLTTPTAMWPMILGVKSATFLANPILSRSILGVKLTTLLTTQIPGFLGFDLIMDHVEPAMAEHEQPVADTRTEYTYRQARSLAVLLATSENCHLNDKALKDLLKHAKVRNAQRSHTQVTQTLKKALRRLVDVGRITVSSMRLINAPPASGGEVEAEIPEHVEALLAQGKRVTARILREKFRCRHWNAGGFPKDLTTAINNILLDFALRDKLMPPTQRGMMSVFSGGQSDARPAAEVGLDVLHVDWQNPYVVGPGNEVRVNRPTDVRQAPRGDIVSWVCKREKCSAKTMALLALAVPCHTWTTMEHVNRHRVDANGNPAPCNYRSKTGAPITHDPEKAKEAKEQLEMAENSVTSALDWIMDGAVQGEQRYVYLENGAYGLLRFEEFMDWLPPQQVCHYCMYEVVLGSGINYTAKKATGIWTNISGWKPRVCNHPPGSHAAQLGGKGEKRAPTFPTLGIAPYAAKRWTPEELHLELMQAMRLG